MDRFIVRVAGMPASALENLRFDQTWSAVQQLIAQDRWLADEGQALSEALYPIIGEPHPRELRPLLVGLRRAVYAVRRPGNRIWSAPVRDALPAEVRARLNAWLVELDSRERRAEDLPRLIAAERQAKLGLLREAVSADAFQHGLIQGSPILYEQLAKWLRGAGTGTAETQTVLRLAKYLSRVVAKTSPYSTFMLSGPGRWVPSGAPALAGTGDWRVRAVVELNGWVAEQIAALLCRHPGLRDGLPVRVNPSAVEQGGRLTFLGVGPGEPIASMLVTDTVRECVDFLRAKPGVTLGALRHHLGSLAAGQPGTGIDRYLNVLIEVGLLECQRPFVDQHEDPLGAMLAWLAPATDPVLRQAREALACLRTQLRAYPGLPGALQRHRAHEAIHGVIAGVLRDLGGSVGDEPAPTVARKNRFHEAVVLTGPVVAWDRDRWRPVLDDLQAVRRFLGIFSPDLPFKLGAATVFRQRYGADARIPLLGFYRTLRELMLAGPATGLDRLWDAVGFDPAGLADSEIPAVAQLAELRQQAGRALFVGTPAGPDGTIRVDRAVLDQLAGSWPEHVPELASVACHLQAVVRDGVPHAVLNGVTIGYGRDRNRLARLMAQAVPGSGTGVDGPRAVQDGVRLAESDGAFGASVNLRTPGVHHELDYPFTVSGRAECDRIPLRDLDVAVDPRTNLLRLVSQADGVPVRPLHLGVMAEYWLPPALRMIVKVFGEPSTLVHASQSWARMAGPPDTPRTRPVVAVPRLDVGRVTVARAAWITRAGEVPSRAKGEADAAYLLRMARWLKMYGIPERCFVRVFHQSANPASMWEAMKARKPMYVDFSNWFLAAVFERSLAHREHLVVIQEALPDLTDTVEYGVHGARTTEYIVEVSSPEVAGG
jgi:hypothetical protein